MLSRHIHPLLAPFTQPNQSRSQRAKRLTVVDGGKQKVLHEFHRVLLGQSALRFRPKAGFRYLEAVVQLIRNEIIKCPKELLFFLSDKPAIVSAQERSSSFSMIMVMPKKAKPPGEMSVLTTNKAAFSLSTYCTAALTPEHRSKSAIAVASGKFKWRQLQEDGLKVTTRLALK